MRRLLLAALFCQTAWGSIAVVHGAAGVITSSGPVVSSGALSTTTGNLIFVLGRMGAASPPNCSTLSGAVTDTAGNSYVQISLVPNSGQDDCAASWYAKNIIGNASNVVTITWNQSATYTTVNLVEVSGLSTSTPFDVWTTGSANSSSVTSGSFTTRAANEIIIAGMVTRATGNTFTAGAGFTLVPAAQDSQGLCGIEYEIVSSVQSAATVSFSRSGGSTYLTILVGTFSSTAIGVTSGIKRKGVVLR